MKPKEDFYITMLRFGKEKMEEGFRQDELVAYLKGKDYPIQSEHSNLLHHYFPKAFYTKDEYVPYPDHVSFYFLRPEGYFHLLEYDNIIANRKGAKETRILSIIAIIIALAAILVPYI